MRARVAAVSADVAARVADPERIAAGVAALPGRSAFADLLPWSPTSLACGDVGAAVLCAALDAAEPGAGWDRTGHRFLTTAAASAGRPGLPPSLFVGATGLLAAATLLGRGGTRYRGLRGQLTAALRPTFDRAAADAGGSGLDVVAGISGWLAALLLADDAPADVLATLGTALGRSRPDLADPGLAHGASGPLAALALLHPRVPGLRDAVRERAAAVSAAEFANATWCAGTAGAARALWLAGCALGDPALRARAEDLALLDAEQRTPTFCHGTAGSLLVSALFWWDTGDERHRAHAARLCARLLAAYEPASLFGFRDAEPEGSTVDNPGVLVGAGGIAMVLTALTAPRPPAWPRLFLLA